MKKLNKLIVVLLSIVAVMFIAFSCKNAQSDKANDNNSKTEINDNSAEKTKISSEVDKKAKEENLLKECYKEGYHHGFAKTNYTFLDYIDYGEKRNKGWIEECNRFELRYKDAFEEEGCSYLYPEALKEFRKGYMVGVATGFVKSHPDEYRLEEDSQIGRAHV